MGIVKKLGAVYNLDMLNDLIILSAKYLYLLVLLLAILAFLWVPKNQKYSLLLLSIITLPCVYIIAKISSHFYFDPRPFIEGHFTPLIAHAADNGFPSDHTLITAALSSIIFFFNKKISAVMWLLTLLVGAARVAAGIHHSVDIIGAIAIAAVVTAIIHQLLQRQRIIAYNSTL